MIDLLSSLGRLGIDRRSEDGDVAGADRDGTVGRGADRRGAGGGIADVGRMPEDEIGAAEEDQGRHHDAGRLVGIVADQGFAGSARNLEGLRIQGLLAPEGPPFPQGAGDVFQVEGWIDGLDEDDPQAVILPGPDCAEVPSSRTTADDQASNERGAWNHHARVRVATIREGVWSWLTAKGPFHGGSGIGVESVPKPGDVRECGGIAQVVPLD